MRAFYFLKNLSVKKAGVVSHNNTTHIFLKQIRNLKEIIIFLNKY